MHGDDEHVSELVAQTSLNLYSSLPRHGKPTIRPNGVPEWTILATISLVIPLSHSSSSLPSSSSSSRSNSSCTPGQFRIIPISLGTGVKVLSANKLPPLGDTIHDSHAEVLARRGFVRWLIQHAMDVVQSQGEQRNEDSLDQSQGAGQSQFGQSQSRGHEENRGQEGNDKEWLEWRNDRFALKNGVQVWLYVSALPCGDASMLYTAAHQPTDMALLKSTSLLTTSGSIHRETVVRGRNGYENYGAIRTKPGRADSIPSTCLSCSDKMASWSVLGIQGGLLDLFEPVYLDGVVVGGTEMPVGWEGGGVLWREKIKKEVERALWGRLECIKGRLPPPYRLHPPAIYLTSIPFSHSRPIISQTSTIEPSPTVTSLSHLPWLAPRPEVIFNGCKQPGSWKPPGKVLGSSNGRSRICRLEILRAYVDLYKLASRLSDCHPYPSIENMTYYNLKHRGGLYQLAKTVLRGSPTPTRLSGEFCGLGRLLVTSNGGTAGESLAPFKGWIVGGRQFGSFTVDGTLVETEG